MKRLLLSLAFVLVAPVCDAEVVVFRTSSIYAPAPYYAPWVGDFAWRPYQAFDQFFGYNRPVVQPIVRRVYVAPSSAPSRLGRLRYSDNEMLALKGRFEQIAVRENIIYQAQLAGLSPYQTTLLLSSK